MPRVPKQKPPTRLIREWSLSPAATLGSAIRARGILLEIRAHLPFKERTLVDIETGTRWTTTPTIIVRRPRP
jgi:hypothetical protein